jgi:HlyD family secretion protein
MTAISKPALGLVALAVLGGAAWYLWPAPDPDDWLGYVEAETMYVAAPVSGRLATRPVERGSAVERGAPLFSLDLAGARNHAQGLGLAAGGA